MQTAAVLADQNRTLPALADGQIDGAGGARHQGDERRFGALADDTQHSMSPLHAHVLDVGVARLGDPQPVQAQQDGQAGVAVVAALGGEQELGRTSSTTFAA
jgi:hypothetical protein